jgi:carbon monoxide dehydrogenase subunit G
VDPVWFGHGHARSVFICAHLWFYSDGMWFTLRKEDLEFIERAPVVHVVEAVATAPRAAVFAALADAESWPRWFPGVRTAGYTSPPPHGVGTIRESIVSGTHWVEEMIAWEDERRWGWTVTGASLPFAVAQVELFELNEMGADTSARWTLALEPRLLARIGAPLTGRTMRRLWQRAMDAVGADRRGAAGASAARG